MADKMYRVVTPRGMTWSVKFHTRSAAWRRVLALKKALPDSRESRASLVAAGWRVRTSEDAEAKHG